MQETLDSTKDEVGNIRQVLDEVKQQVSTVGGETERAALNIQELIEEKSKVQADRAQKPIVDELAEVDAKLGELSMSLNLNQTDLKGCAERIEEYGLDTQVKLAEMDQRLEEVSQKTLGLERHMVTVISTLTELVKSMDKLSSDLRSQRVEAAAVDVRSWSTLCSESAQVYDEDAGTDDARGPLVPPSTAVEIPEHVSPNASVAAPTRTPCLTYEEQKLQSDQILDNFFQSLMRRPSTQPQGPLANEPELQPAQSDDDIPAAVSPRYRKPD